MPLLWQKLDHNIVWQEKLTKFFGDWNNKVFSFLLTLSARRKAAAESGSQIRVVISLARDVTLCTSHGVFWKSHGNLRTRRWIGPKNCGVSPSWHG
jgi:hypothetical protein